MAPVPLALLCLRYRPAGVDDPAEIDAINETLLERVNDSGQAYLTHTRLGGPYVIRFAIGQTATEWRHVAAGVVRVVFAAQMEQSMQRERR